MLRIGVLGFVYITGLKCGKVIAPLLHVKLHRHALVHLSTVGYVSKSRGHGAFMGAFNPD